MEQVLEFVTGDVTAPQDTDPARHAIVVCCLDNSGQWGRYAGGRMRTTWVGGGVLTSRIAMICDAHSFLFSIGFLFFV